MAGFLPFEPLVVAASAGRSVYIAAVSTSSKFVTIDSTGGYTPNVLITNLGTVTLWVRMSQEAVPAATTTDVPMVAGSRRMFANPNPTGVAGFAAIGTATGNGQIVITPGQGGI